MRIIGLTGNIACGKSTVANLLEKQGIPVVDADKVSRDVCQTGSRAFLKIANTFGPKAIIDGQINRKFIRSVVFENSKMRRKLEAILHPEIAKESNRQFREHQKQGHKLIIYEASLLIEAGRKSDFDGILLITCTRKQQLQNLKSRDKQLSRSLGLAMIQSQMPQVKKKKHATWVIHNDGTLKELKIKVLNWLRSVKSTGDYSSR